MPNPSSATGPVYHVATHPDFYFYTSQISSTAALGYTSITSVATAVVGGIRVQLPNSTGGTVTVVIPLVASSTGASS